MDFDDQEKDLHRGWGNPTDQPKEDAVSHVPHRLAENLKVSIDIDGDPNECTEFTYGFTYGGLEKRIPEPHHPS